MKSLKDIQSDLRHLAVRADNLANELDEHIPEESTINNIHSARDSSGQIVLTWDGSPRTGNTLDVQFKNTEVDKWHSVQWMINDDLDADEYDYNPPYLTGNMNIYTFRIPPEMGVKVRLVEGIFNKNQKQFIGKILGEESFDPVLKYNKLIGYWDSWNAPETGMNLFKDYISHIDRSVDKGTLIPHISGFSHGMTESKIKSRIDDRLPLLNDNADVLFWLLQDEPFLHGITPDEFTRINQIAESFGIDYGWTISDNAINNIDFHDTHEMTIGINTYLLLYEEYPWKFIQTRQQFMDECNRIFDNARTKLPNCKFIFVGQAFYNPWGENEEYDQDKHKYRPPTVKSINWTYEFVTKNEDIIATLWYTYASEEGAVCAKDMLQIKQKIQNIA